MQRSPVRSRVHGAVGHVARGFDPRAEGVFRNFLAARAFHEAHVRCSGGEQFVLGWPLRSRVNSAAVWRVRLGGRTGSPARILVDG